MSKENKWSSVYALLAFALLLFATIAIASNAEGKMSRNVWTCHAIAASEQLCEAQASHKDKVKAEELALQKCNEACTDCKVDMCVRVR